jgi:hypothetical protein
VAEWSDEVGLSEETKSRWRGVRGGEGGAGTRSEGARGR